MDGDEPQVSLRLMRFDIFLRKKAKSRVIPLTGAYQNLKVNVKENIFIPVFTLLLLLYAVLIHIRQTNAAFSEKSHVLCLQPKRPRRSVGFCLGLEVREGSGYQPKSHLLLGGALLGARRIFGTRTHFTRDMRPSHYLFICSSDYSRWRPRRWLAGKRTWSTRTRLLVRKSLSATPEFPGKFSYAFFHRSWPQQIQGSTTVEYCGSSSKSALHCYILSRFSNLWTICGQRGTYLHGNFPLRTQSMAYDCLKKRENKTIFHL